MKHALVAECDECFFDECSRREKWLLHRILRPTSPLAPEYCSNDARRCERPRRRRRRPVDALLPRGSFTSRSKLPVVCRRGLDASSSGIASLPPAGPGPSFVGANRGCLPRKASTCARLIDRVSRRRLQTGRSPRRAAAARGAAQRPRGRGPVQDHDAAKTTSRTGRRGAAAPRRHSRPPGPFWGQPGAGPGRAPPIKQSARARGYTVVHIASRRRRRRSPSRRGRAGRFHTSCRTAGLW